jgi:hypothetical protein
VNAIQSEDWRAPIVAAVRGYYEAEDGVTDKRVALRERNYHIIDGNLYRGVHPIAKMHISNRGQTATP